MKVQNIFYVICDISGYTQFIKNHHLSLLHAEEIINELLSSVIQSNQTSLVSHEILGDAIVFYCENDGSQKMAQKIYEQSKNFIAAFEIKKKELMNSLEVCYCNACRALKKLQLKIIVHQGEAVFTKVHHIKKVSGLMVICAHRLLKNSIRSKEYILMSDSFVNQLGTLVGENIKSKIEYCEGLCKQNIYVKYLSPENQPANVFQQLNKFINWKNVFNDLFVNFSFGNVGLR